jgi:hypothetical protein
METTVYRYGYTYKYNKLTKDIYIQKKAKNRKLEFIFHWFGLTSIQLGFHHLDLYMHNIEIHFPGGFIRIGYECKWDYTIKKG